MSQEMPNLEEPKEEPAYENSQILPLKGKETKEIKRQRWESQFKVAEMIDLDGGSMKIIDLRPEKEKTDVPMVFLRGWGTTAGVYKEALMEMADRDRRVIAIDEPAGIESMNIQGKEMEKAKEMGIPELELRKVAALLKAIDDRGLEKVDIMTHSEGAIYGTYAAALRPERFRNFILVNPAGMVGEHGAKELVTNAGLDIALQTVRIWKRAKESLPEHLSLQGRSMGALGAIGKSSASKLKLKNTLGSIGVISKTEIDELLRDLSDLGIDITIIRAADDKFFPESKVQERVSRAKKEGADIDYIIVGGTHNQIYLDERIVGAADKIFDLKEKRQKKKELEEGLGQIEQELAFA